MDERSHPRSFRGNQYVYPVLSRRAGGISVGINLSPAKTCTFNCLYCQVDRTAGRPARPPYVDIPTVVTELKSVLSGLAPGGAFWSEPEFSALPPEKKRVVDIAFSGDGEPTMFRDFAPVVEQCVFAKESFKPVFADAKVVLITNGSGLNRPQVRHALEFLDEHNCEVWAKLDAGTPEFFARLNRSSIPYLELLGNLWACARARPVVIQSCFVRVDGASPPPEEIAAWLGRLKEITSQGGKIKLVQVYTVARPPMDPSVSSLSNEEVDALAARVRSETGLAAEAFYGG